MILGARVLAEFGDDLDRYRDARARKNYSGMAPATRTSGPPRTQPPPGRRALPTGLPRPEQLIRACAYYGATAPAVTPATKPYAPWPTGSSESSRLPAPSHPHDETHAWAAHTATVA